MSLTVTRGTALYVGALLGPGLMVLPGLAAQLAGPASILAWVGLLGLSGLLAAVFAALGTAHPAAGGVAGYTRLGLGERAARATTWLFLAGIVAGAPVICLVGATYLNLTPALTAAAGATLLLIVLGITLRGVQTSANVQLILVGALLLVVLAAVAGGASQVDPAHLTPFAPKGWTSVGRACALLMMAFVGWEAIAPLADRFRHPRRDLPRVIGYAFAITAAIYLAISTITVLALGPRAASASALAGLLTMGFGPAGPVIAAVSAVVLATGTVNAYLAGGAALSPRPRLFLLTVLAADPFLLFLVGSGRLSITTAITMATAFFLAVYLACLLAAVRILRGLPRWLALIAAVAVTAILCFTGYAILPAMLICGAALLSRPSPPTRTPSDPVGVASRTLD